MDYVVEAEDPSDGATVIVIVGTATEALSRGAALKREGHTHVMVLDPSGAEIGLP